MRLLLIPIYLAFFLIGWKLAPFVLDNKREYSQVECKKAIEYLEHKGTRYER